jgi:heme exporter protein D
MDLNLQELAMLSFTPLIRLIQNWWLQRAERHYLICADVEQQRAREAQANVAYYQKRAALARSARQ